MKTSPIRFAPLVLLSGMLPTTIFAADISAGTVMYAIGDARAYDTDGTTRYLKRGDPVATGDRLSTGVGRLQLRLRDGGLIALQPNTDFALESYVFNDALDGSENAVLRLLKGGIRAATGLIGQRNRGSYELRTYWGTIGIRGTTYKARICDGDCSVPDGLYARGGEGVIVVANGGGQLELSMGERAFVGSPDTAPVPTQIEPDIDDIPPVQTAEAEGPVTDTSFIAGQALFQASISGVSATVPLGAATVAVSGSGALEGAGTVGSTDLDGLSRSGAVHGAASLSQAGEELDILSGMFNEQNGLIGFSGERINDSGEREAGAFFVTNVVDVHSDGILYLGRWTDGTVTAFADGGFSAKLELDRADSIHYIVALDEITLPGSGTARYDFNGMTTSSTGTDGSIGSGIVSGHVLVDFGSTQVDTAFTVDHGGSLAISTSGDFISSTPVFTSDGSATGVGCESFCSVSADGIVAGPGATPERLGLSYQIEQADRSIVGVGGFSLP